MLNVKAHLGGITVVAQGGSGTFEYSINSGIYQNNGVFTLLATGSHVITVRDANHTTCTKDFNFVVEEPAVALTLNASVTDPIACHGDADATVTLLLRTDGVNILIHLMA